MEYFKDSESENDVCVYARARMCMYKFVCVHNYTCEIPLLFTYLYI